MKHIFTLLALGCLSIPLASMAQYADPEEKDSDETSTRLIITKTSPQDKKILESGKPQGPHEIPVPHFVVKSTNNNFLMTIGGQISTIIGWDFGNDLYENPDAGINFVTQEIAVPATKGHKHDFYINPYQTALDLQVVGLAGTPNQITGYVKLKTNGNNSSVNLNKAYVSWRGFTIGKKSSLMEDADACQPPTIDPEGPCGILGSTVMELSYKSKNYSGFQWAIGLDLPTFYSSNGLYRGKDYPVFDDKEVASAIDDTQQMLPDIPMWIQYGGKNRIRISAMLRNFFYHDLVTDKTRHAMGWGLMASGNLQPCDLITIYYQGAYGKGIGSYLQDIAGMPLSFIPDDANPGRMVSSPMMGISVGASFNFTSRLQMNIMGSESRIWDVGEYATTQDDCNYKYALYGAANLFYNISSYFQVGVEYIYGKRETWNHTSGHDNRVQAQVLFTL